MAMNWKKTLICLLLVLAALVSFTLVGNKTSSVETHAQRIASIDSKVDTVLKLTSSTTFAAAVTSALPDDTATPIANKLADLTEYFLFILCVLYAEKYLLTVLGFAVFKVVIPIACGVGIFTVLVGRGRFLSSLAWRIALGGLVLYFAIPVGLRVSDGIYETYETSLNATITAAEEIADAADTSDQSLLDRLAGTFTDLKDRVAGLLKGVIEAVAVMIVTTCVIPILTFLFMLWVIKLLTGPEMGALLALPPRPQHGRPVRDGE